MLFMIEKFKESRDKGGCAAAVLMDLSKAFDTINHKLLIAKFRAYGFGIHSLEILFDYLSDRWQRTKVNSTFSTSSLLLCGMAQGGKLGPKFFNIYLNDMFFEFVNTQVCNIADDTTIFACGMELRNIIERLENDITSVIYWFSANFMVLNAPKCHLLVSSPTTSRQQMYIEVGGQVIWESKCEILLGVSIDNDLTFYENVEILNKKAGQKLSALTRMARIAPLEKKKVLMNSFIQSQYGYCVEVWMFTSRKLNNKINSIHKRALQAVYLDYSSTFAELLEKDKSITIHQRNIQLVAIEMFKAAKEIGPDIVRDLFNLSLSLSFEFSK